MYVTDLCLILYRAQQNLTGVINEQGKWCAVL